MMKKIVFFISLALVCNTIKAQIELTASLVDSLASNLYNIKYRGKVEYRPILNFAQLKGQQNFLYVSSTSIKVKENIKENMMIYINEKNLFFVILRNVSVDSSFLSRLIEHNDPRFEKTLDSIKFGAGPFSGLVIMRSPLTVYRIHRRALCKNTYVITSKNYIPYLSAPEEFIPIKKFGFGSESTEIEPWYYDAFGNLNKQYYEDLKPGKKIILRMPKEK
ncbi:MAG: hypothetical protein PHX39_14355 [Bacteroidales bacterium]|jgi:hypothetical protein|nr:hypothetical protein [Bacteroidales bacterium]